MNYGLSLTDRLVGWAYRRCTVCGRPAGIKWPWWQRTPPLKCSLHR